MGQIAAQKADLVFVTADNSRTEDTMQIISDILGGIDLDLQNQKIKIVPDRRQAIQEAVCYASANDTVILAGKGHEMYEINKKTKLPAQNKDGSFKSKTSHTLNPVPCIIYDNFHADKYAMKKDEGNFGLSNVAATMVNLMGYDAPEKWDESVIELK